MEEVIPYDVESSNEMSLSLNEIRFLLVLITEISRRGVLKPAEFISVGTIYQKLSVIEMRGLLETNSSLKPIGEVINNG